MGCYLQDYKRETRRARTPEQTKIVEEISRLEKYLDAAKRQDRGRVLLGYTLKNEDDLPKAFTILFNTAQKQEQPFLHYTPVQNFKYLVEYQRMHIADALLAITANYSGNYRKKNNLQKKDEIYEELRRLYTYLKIVERTADQFLLSYRFLDTLPVDFMEMVEAARVRELMMQYDHLVRDQKNNLVNALLTIIDSYASAYVHRQTRQGEKDEVCVELDNLKAHLKSEPKVGKIVLGYAFQHAMPQDFMKLFEAVKGLEQERVNLIATTTTRTPSCLVSESENAIAAGCYSVEALFAETAKLEEAMLKNERNPKANPLSEKHKDEIGGKIQKWTNELAQKIPELMIKSTSAAQLTRWINEKLRDDLLSSTFGLTSLKEEMLSQVDYLEDQGFFKPGYNKLRLADKYQYVQDFVLQLKCKNKLPSQLEGTFLSLLEAIEKKSICFFGKAKKSINGIARCNNRLRFYRTREFP